jgi:hypothetical protein
MGQIIITSRKKIKELGTNFAPGPDGITLSLIKNLGERIITPLEFILKKSLATGKVPREWKHMVVKDGQVTLKK